MALCRLQRGQRDLDRALQRMRSLGHIACRQ
jgi:hypothetical protein